MRGLLTIGLTLALINGVAASDTKPKPLAPPPQPYRFWPPNQRDAQREIETALNAVPTAKSLRAQHALIGEFPHYAGTPKDLVAAEKLAENFRALGLEVEKQELWVYLAEPLYASLELLSPIKKSFDLKERVLPEDAYTRHPDLGIGWNAFSGTGDVTASVVYANYGRKEDFQKLREMNIDVAGKIVIARYGGNYRGYKAKFAEEAGAVGLIIYTDPADSGYMRGPMYPEGSWANETSIQRGSIKTLPYAGDALTPFVAATKNAKRIDPLFVSLPKIPVQPIGWGAAGEILVRMRGLPVPKGWQGGLPFTYRATADDDLRVRLNVQQARGVKKIYNVVGTLRGETHPQEKVIVGCHYDAWTFGAADPLAGTMVLLESARSFAKLAREGKRPARSIVFGLWGAEEFGIIGSTEWVEAHAEDLSKNALAYINLDMAAMGMNFGSSAAPVLQPLISDAARAVNAHQDEKTVYDHWIERNEDPLVPGQPRFHHLGGGSDHVGFYCHLAIPSASIGAGGSAGTSYHSNYDTLNWYRKTVGDDYESARMVTRVTNLFISRMANAPLIPYDPVGYGPGVHRIIDEMKGHIDKLDFEVDLSRVTDMSKRYEARASEVYRKLLDRVERDALSPERLAGVNKSLFDLNRKWFYEPGLPGGLEWHRNLYATTDPDSGYAAWMLPAFRWAIKEKNANAILSARRIYYGVFEKMLKSIDEIDAHLGE